jgi:hypothetical protein
MIWSANYQSDALKFEILDRLSVGLEFPEMQREQKHAMSDLKMPTQKIFEHLIIHITESIIIGQMRA